MFESSKVQEVGMGIGCFFLAGRNSCPPQRGRIRKVWADRNVRTPRVRLLLAASLTLAASASALNLEKYAFHRPNFFVHSLDVELHGDLALVSGYGGLMLYDVAGDAITFLGRFAPGGGGRGSGVPYNATARGTVAFAAAREYGWYVVDISNPAAPSEIARWDEAGKSVENFAIRDDLLAVSMHRDGVWFFDAADPARLEPLGELADLNNTWCVRFNDDGVMFIADDEGGLVVATFDGENANVLARVETSGAAIDIRLNGDRCAVACGAMGVDLFDVSEPGNPRRLSNINTPTYAGHIGFDGSLIAVADWNEVLVYDASDPEHPFLDGRRPTETRAMGVDLRGDQVFVADWRDFLGLRYGPVAGADIDVSTRRISPGAAERIDTTLAVFNTGGSNLNVRVVNGNAANFSADPVVFTVAPDETVAVAIAYDVSADDATINIRSNDRDESTLAITLDGNGGLGVGSEAPDFTAPLLDGGQYHLADMAGRVQLLIFWTSW
ncbi:MAG: hypothetical protein FJY65_07415 [Calditrichaeota bacterium]|nr:hypothetical protein [Calditrichota bacterium]